MPAPTVAQLAALRAQPHASKAYLAVLAPQDNVVLYGVVTGYVKDNAIAAEYITITISFGTIAAVLPGMTLWAGVGANDYSLGRTRVKLASSAFGINYIEIAETDEIPFVVGTVVSIFQEYLPWVKLPWIAPDGTIEKDHNIGFAVAPNQQTVLWPPVAMCLSAAVGVMNGVVGGIAYVYFDGSASYATAPSATIASYAWTIYNPDGSVYSTPSAVATPGYLSFVTQGVYIIQLIVTDSNGISSTTHRQMLIVDPLNPLEPYYAYTAFEVTRYEGDNDNGWGADFRVEGQSDTTYFPECAQVLLYADDWYGPSTRNNGYQVTSPTHGNTFADNAGVGTIAWSNPSNALALDQIYATVVFAGIQNSHYLFASNFGFTIPTTAQILGVSTSVVAKASGSSARDFSVRLFVAGAVAGADNAVAALIASTDTRYTFGSNSDMWALALTPAIINASNFGVGYSFRGQGGAVTTSVDYIDMTVYYYDDTGIGFEAHRSNVKYNGYLLKDSVTLDPQTSVVAFETGSIARVMAQQYMRPTFTQDTLVPTTWSESYALTMRRALLYLLYWHSTLCEIADVLIGNDTTPVQVADFPKQNFWDMLRNFASAKRFMHTWVTKNGKLTIARDPQVRTAVDRNSFAIVVQLQSSDWQGNVTIDEVPQDEVAFADVSGVWYEGNPAANGIPIFSKAPGFTPSVYGRDLAVQYLATTGQLDLNALAGNILHWRNNYNPKVSLKMAGNWVSAFDTGLVEYSKAPSAGFVTQRGMLLANARLIARQMSVSVDNSTGVWTTDITFEAESPVTPSGVIGDYPPGALAAGAEACPLGAVWNNSTRVCDVLGTTASQYPWSDKWRSTVIVSTFNKGFYITNNFQGPSGGALNMPTWSPMNTGLVPVLGIIRIDQFTYDPYNPSFLYCVVTGTGVTSLLYYYDPTLATWKLIDNASAFATAKGIANTTYARWRMLAHDWMMPPGYISAVISNVEDVNDSTYFFESTDYGVTWSAGVKVGASTGASFSQTVLGLGVSGVFRGASATTVTNMMYVPLVTRAFNGQGQLFKSVNRGAAWAGTGVSNPTYNLEHGIFWIDPSNHDVLWHGENDIRQFTAQGAAVAIKLAGVGPNSPVASAENYSNMSKYALSVLYNPSGNGQVIRTFNARDAAHKNRLYSSANAGTSWTSTDGTGMNLTGYPFGVVEMWDAPGKLYAISNNSPSSPDHTIWTSEDAGATWVGRSGNAAGYATPGDGTGIPYDCGGIVDIDVVWNS